MRGYGQICVRHNIPFALRYDLRTVSLTLSIQRDSTPSKPPSPSMSSSLLMSIGPSLSRSTIPLRLRISMTHTRKNKSMKRNVDSTMRSGNKTNRASCGGAPPRPSGMSGTSKVSFCILLRMPPRVFAAAGDNKYGREVRSARKEDWTPLRPIVNFEDRSVMKVGIGC